MKYTRGAKRRAKKDSARQTLYPQFEREEPVAPADPQEEPQKAMLRARGIAVGQNPTDALKDAMLETQAGQCLWVAVLDAEERRDLFNVFAEYERALSLFHSRCLGQKRFPAVSKMEFMPERLEASASDNVDLRTSEEKADASRKRMREMEEALDSMFIWNRAIIRDVAFHARLLVANGELTSNGRNFVAALREFKEVLG